MKPSHRQRPCRDCRVAGVSLVEFALVAPLLILIVLGGICLMVRLTFRDALDEAAEQAAWAAARTGGDPAAVQRAISRSAPFIPAAHLDVCVNSAGYHTEVVAVIAYTGPAIASLPLFREPLEPAQATATNQQERSFSLGSCGSPIPIAEPVGGGQPESAGSALSGWTGGPAAPPGPAQRPAGPAWQNP